MGLDVYLYRSEDRDAQNAVIEAASARCEEIWKEICGDVKYEQIPEEKRNEARAATKAHNLSVGLTEDGTHPGQVCIENPSAKHPKHGFKIGYFRSSYNEGGINRILGRMGLPDLGDIFNNPEGEYEFTPDWATAKKEAEDVLRRYREADRSFDIMRVSPNHFASKQELADSEDEARLRFLKVRGEHTKRGTDKFFGGSFSNIEGDFFLAKPLRVIALLPGTDNIFKALSPCTYVVYEIEREDGKGDYYEEALEIVIETCTWVMAQPDARYYYLHWSG